MKKAILFISLALILCFGLTGCKSKDYNEAVEYQTAGDYAAALAIYQGIGGYKDSADRIAYCEAMISAIDAFNLASGTVAEKNAELNSVVAEAEGLISQKETALDNTLIPTLETAISEAKAAKKTVPTLPESAEEIIIATEALNKVDYTDVLSNLSTKKANLEYSVKQYALVNAPSEAYIIECLGRVANVVDISAVTEDNDPNGMLNKMGGYMAQVYFSSDLVDQGAVYGNTVIDKGTACGGSIEVYATPEYAENRSSYLAGFDGSLFATGSHVVIGTVVVRTSNELMAAQQKELEANIIAELTAVEE